MSNFVPVFLGILFFILSVFISAGLMYFASKITRTSGEYWHFLVAMVLSNITSFVPFVGFWLSIWVFFEVLHRLTQENRGDLVLVVLIYFLLAITLKFAVYGYFTA